MGSGGSYMLLPPGKPVARADSTRGFCLHKKFENVLTVDRLLRSAFRCRIVIVNTRNSLSDLAQRQESLETVLVLYDQVSRAISTS